VNRYKQRPRDFAYMAWVRTQQCIACESQRLVNFGTIYAHHAGQRAFARKADDRTCIPLCWRHHDRNGPASIHTLGKRFWVAYGLEREAVIAELIRRYELETEWKEAA
jgi:hypothetical protein